MRSGITSMGLTISPVDPKRPNHETSSLSVLFSVGRKARRISANPTRLKSPMTAIFRNDQKASKADPPLHGVRP
jgi:hypothetical protein